MPGAELLRLARRSIEHGLVHDEPLPVDCGALPRDLAEPRATFTTLSIDEALRGCCGTLEAERPLATDVAYSAFQAAFRDSRFPPLREHELEGTRLEVSVLSPMEALHAASEEELLQHLRPGTDGLVIVDGWRRATFLPKVWESLPDPRRFLAALKNKCGLPENYWSEQLRFHRYHTTSYRD